MGRPKKAIGDTKFCNGCTQELPLSKFGVDRSKWHGLTARCKPCMASAAKASRDKDPEKARETVRRYRKRHYEKELARNMRYVKANPEVFARASAKRRADKLKATPQWLTEEHKQELKEIYANARRLSNAVGIPFHVDHVIPLRGCGVCGLHVPWNLKPIPAKVNMAKGNKYAS